MADRFPADRPNPPDLVPFAEARASVLERLRPLPVREVGLGDALGSVLAADVAAAEDLPPFANSAMDGFAVRGADLAGAAEDPAAVGMLASVGRKAVPVHPRPRVTVVSTGDELVDPGDPLGPGQIRDSNSWLLAAQVRAAGMEAFRCGRLRDDPEV